MLSESLSRCAAILWGGGGGLGMCFFPCGMASRCWPVQTLEAAGGVREKQGSLTEFELGLLTGVSRRLEVHWRRLVVCQ